MKKIPPRQSLGIYWANLLHTVLTRLQKDNNSTCISGHEIVFKQAHSSVERAALLGGVRMRKLETNEKFSLTAETLQSALEKDFEQGLIPFFVS